MAGAIHQTLTGAGFMRMQMFTSADLTYLGVNRILYRASCEIQRLLALRPLQPARALLLGVCTKPWL